MGIGKTKFRQTEKDQDFITPTFRNVSNPSFRTSRLSIYTFQRKRSQSCTNHTRNFSGGSFKWTYHRDWELINKWVANELYYMPQRMNTDKSDTALRQCNFINLTLMTRHYGPLVLWDYIWNIFCISLFLSSLKFTMNNLRKTWGLIVLSVWASPASFSPWFN